MVFRSPLPDVDIPASSLPAFVLEDARAAAIGPPSSTCRPPSGAVLRRAWPDADELRRGPRRRAGSVAATSWRCAVRTARSGRSSSTGRSPPGAAVATRLNSLYTADEIARPATATAARGWSSRSRRSSTGCCPRPRPPAWRRSSCSARRPGATPSWRSCSPPGHGRPEVGAAAERHRRAAVLERDERRPEGRGADPSQPGGERPPDGSPRTASTPTTRRLGVPPVLPHLRDDGDPQPRAARRARRS